MNIFGLTIARTKDIGSLMPPASRGGWWPVVRESFAGAWQRNITADRESVLSYSTVWACITLIASDISKLWVQLKEKDANGICTEVLGSSPFKGVLDTPNHYQTRVKFFEHWMLSKLIYGNTYVLKEREPVRGIVTALYILDPSRVQVLTAPNGDVFYQLSQDVLSGLTDSTITVPAREIIHDVMVPLFHPLVGVSPIFACGVAASQGLRIQDNQTISFANGLQLSGVITSPQTISTEAAERVSSWWDSNFGQGRGAGKTAVLGDGLHFEPMSMTPVDVQLIDQVKMLALQICGAFHVPPYMVGIGAPPPYTDIQSLFLQYYLQALQNHLENIEELLDKGLELPTAPRELHVEFDTTALLRMDTKTQVENATKGILGGLWKPNEARADFDLPPVEGGDTVYLQQQQYSLAALNRRDQAPPTPNQIPPPPPDGGQKALTTGELTHQSGVLLRKALGIAA